MKRKLLLFCFSLLAVSQLSPAIDKGKRDAIPALALNTDQRGMLRPADFASIPNATGGDGSDIGAFEVQAPPPSCSLVVTNTNDSGPGSLRAAIDCANSTPGL